MTSRFRVLTTPSFERDFRKTSKGNQVLVNALEELVAILAEDPHNRSGRHPIKKLAGLRHSEGQWRIRWREYRLRRHFWNGGRNALFPPSKGSLLTASGASVLKAKPTGNCRGTSNWTRETPVLHSSFRAQFPLYCFTHYLAIHPHASAGETGHDVFHYRPHVFHRG